MARIVISSYRACECGRDQAPPIGQASRCRSYRGFASSSPGISATRFRLARERTALVAATRRVCVDGAGVLRSILCRGWYHGPDGGHRAQSRPWRTGADVCSPAHRAFGRPTRLAGVVAAVVPIAGVRSRVRNGNRKHRDRFSFRNATTTLCESTLRRRCP